MSQKTLALLCAVSFTTLAASSCAPRPTTRAQGPQAEQQAGKAGQAGQAGTAMPQTGPSAQGNQKQGGPDQLTTTTSKQGTAEVTTERKVTVTEQHQIPTVTKSKTRADLNRMDSDQLVAIGAPKTLADQIVQYRSQEGAFSSVDQLRSVPGMDEITFNKLKNRVDVG